MDFFEIIKNNSKRLNECVSLFNKWKNTQFKYIDVEDLEKVDVNLLKRIIYDHKGDYTFNKDEKIGFSTSLKNYIMGRGDSASSLAKKNTYLKLINVLIPVIDSQKRFMDCIRKIGYLPFGENKKFNVRKEVNLNISEAIDIYSAGFFGSAVFVIGKTLEKIITDYLILLKNNKKINYKIKEIRKWDFDTKINILHKEKFLTPNQYSKIMSIKWDRNVLAHPATRSDIKQIKDDSDAIIKIGLNLIELLERRLKKLSSIKSTMVKNNI